MKITKCDVCFQECGGKTECPQGHNICYECRIELNGKYYCPLCMEKAIIERV